MPPDYLSKWRPSSSRAVCSRSRAARPSVRDRLVAELPQTLDPNERQFLLSLVSNAPEWPLLGIAHLEQLPAVRWKMRNLEQLAETSPKKFAEQEGALKRLLG
jgi:hypothetical protein